MTLFAWLFTIAGPLVANVLIGLGIGTVTYVGFDALLSNLIDMVKFNILNVPVDLLVFLKMGGIIDAFGILFGAITAKLLLASLTRFQITAA